MPRKGGNRSWVRNMGDGPLDIKCSECISEIPRLGEFVIICYKCYDEWIKETEALQKEIEELRKKVEGFENDKKSESGSEDKKPDNEKHAD